MTATEDAVRRHFAVVADLGSTEDDLRAAVTPEAMFVELPNAISPTGHTRTLEDTVAGFLRGKTILTAQSIDIAEVLVDSDRASVRSTWKGTMGGQEIVAHMAGFLTVRDGLIARHETYDCYEPFTLP